MRKILITTVLCFTSTAWAASNYEIPRITEEPSVDGELSEGEWDSAAIIELGYETWPSYNIPAPVNTTVYMMEDGEKLYFAFKADDPEPDKIRAFFRDRDGILDDDYVSVFFDTFNDERSGFRFSVNPLGSQADFAINESQNVNDSSWDAVWESAGKVTDSGYIVEMAIPYRALRFPSNMEEQIWGLRLLRAYPRDSWTLFSETTENRELDCRFCQASKMSGMPNLNSSTRNIDLTPTATYLSNQDRDTDPIGPWSDGSNKTEFGADLRWAITEDWVLNATLNPDFSQIEADANQLDINNTFSLFFRETRPFFLDGADYFQSMNRLVHTRNIADPDYGFKVTGKTNGYSLGVMAASDQSTSFLVPSSLGSRVINLEGVSSDIAVVRGQMDIGDQNTLGMLLTHRGAGDYQNQVASIDGRYYFTPKDRFRYQFMSSSSENPDSIRFDQDGDLELDSDGQPLFAPDQSDRAYVLRYNHNEDNSGLFADYFDFGSDFRADMGFIGKVDFKQLVIGGRYNWYGEEGSKWTQWGFFGDWDRTEDQSGLKLEEEFELYLNARGPMQFNTNIGGLIRNRYFGGEYFDEQSFRMWFELSPLSVLTIGNFMSIGDQVDFTHTELGESVLFQPYIIWQIGQHLSVNLDLSYQSLDVPAKQRMDEDTNMMIDFEEGNLFEALIADIRVAYQFNSRSRLSLTLQHNNTDRNTQLYLANRDSDPDNDRDAKTRRFGTQLIYSYELNPQTAFHLGYSDNALENDQINSLELVERTIFAKFGYMFQL